MIAQQLARVPMAPRLPFALSLLYPLMQAVQRSGRGLTTKVVNAIFPDMVHPILQQVGLAPLTGIGDLANNIPAIRVALAHQWQIPLSKIEARLIAAHWVSYWMSRMDVTGAPYHLSVVVDGQNATARIKRKELFQELRTTLKRVGGTESLLMTASSALVVCQALLCNQSVLTHAPGPHGLPGGYPVKINAQEIVLDLPFDLTLEGAKQINEAGLRFDGIERFEPDGTVVFTDEAVCRYKELLGYECPRLPLAEVKEQAEELQQHYEQART